MYGKLKMLGKDGKNYIHGDSERIQFWNCLQTFCSKFVYFLPLSIEGYNTEKCYISFILYERELRCLTHREENTVGWIQQMKRV